LSFPAWRQERSLRGFLTLQAASSRPDFWSRMFDRWRQKLGVGRPPCIALLITLTYDKDSPYKAYPDLDGVCDIVDELMMHVKSGLLVRAALNFEAEQISIQWSLCNRFRHMFAIGTSDFATDRRRIQPSPIRDA
jgi:hypothetical protein